jgi:putative peptidoglycan lipid II flippase
VTSLKKTAIFITFITLACKLFGFAREVILAYFYGTSYVVDAYLMATSIPGILFGWLSSIAIAYTPIFTDIKTSEGESRSKQFTNNLLSTIILVALICAVLGITFSKAIVSITAPGFEGNVYDLTVNFTKVSIWAIMVSAPIQILAAYLNCHKKFIRSSLSNLVVSSTQMLVILLSAYMGVEILIYGYLISNLIQLFVLILMASNIGHRFRPYIRVDYHLKRAVIVMIPIFISSTIAEINVFVDRMFASGLGEGSIASLNYAAILKRFLYYLFSTAIMTIIYPILSQHAANGDMKNLKKFFIKTMNIIIILFVPITVGAIILAEPAIFFVYQRGEFTHQSTLMTAYAFMMYTVGLVPLAMIDLLVKVFYSMQDTKKTMYLGALTVVLNITFNSILIKSLGHVGLALGSSLAAFCTLPVFILLLRKKIGSIGINSASGIIFKSILSTALMGSTVYLAYHYLLDIMIMTKTNSLILMAISGVVGGLIYFTSMLLLKVKEIQDLINLIKKVFMKNTSKK